MRSFWYYWRQCWPFWGGATGGLALTFIVGKTVDWPVAIFLFSLMWFITFVVAMAFARFLPRP